MKRPNPFVQSQSKSARPKFGSIPPRPPDLSSFEYPDIWSKEWLNTWDPNEPKYGWSPNLPCFTSWAILPQLTLFPDAKELNYPSNELMGILKKFHEEHIYQRWQGTHFPSTKEEDFTMVKGFIEDATNFSVLYKYFTENCPNMLNFYGIFVPKLNPPYFNQVLKLPQAWKGMVLILFTQAFLVKNFAISGLTTPKVIWRQPPLNYIGPSNRPFVLHMIESQYTLNDYRLIAWIEDVGLTNELLFPFKGENSLEILDRLLRTDLNGKIVPQYKQYFTGFDNYDDIRAFAIKCNRQINQELQENMSPEKWNELNGKLAEIKPIDVKWIFRDVAKSERINWFKETWKRTAAGDSLIDKTLQWFKGESVPEWPFNFGFQYSDPPTQEDYLLRFMLEYPPPKLKVPPRKDFFTPGIEAQSWLDTFEKQWNDYLLWCEKNSIAKLSSDPKEEGTNPNWSPPGTQLRNSKGELIVDKKTRQPLINIYPDYGLMDKDATGRGWYNYVPNFFFQTANWYWGTDFLTWAGGEVKRLFAAVIQALVEIVKFVIQVAFGVIKAATNALFNLDFKTIAIIVVGGFFAFEYSGSYIQGLGANAAKAASTAIALPIIPP